MVDGNGTMGSGRSLMGLSLVAPIFPIFQGLQP